MYENNFLTFFSTYKLIFWGVFDRLLRILALKRGQCHKMGFFVIFSFKVRLNFSSNIEKFVDIVSAFCFFESAELQKTPFAPVIQN